MQIEQDTWGALRISLGWGFDLYLSFDRELAFLVAHGRYLWDVPIGLA